MKFLKLKRRLALSHWQTVGLLESLWLFTQVNTPHGDIGRYSNEDIAAAIEYEGDPDALIQHLVECRWLDNSELYRIVVHDWHQHAPNYIKGSVASSGGQFVTQPHHSEPCGEEQIPSESELSSRGAKHGGLAGGLSRGAKPGGQASPQPNLTKPNQTQPNQNPFAASPPVAEPLPPERRGKAPKPPPKPRAPDELFDAIVAVTGCDPSVNGSHVGRVKKVLLAADPPYTPAEILRMGTPEFQRMHMPWLEGRTLLNVGEVQSHAYRTRLPDVVANSDAKRTGRDRFRADTDPVADKYTPQGIARLRGESASPVAGNAAAVGPPDGPSPAESSSGEAGGNDEGLSW